MRIVRPIGPFKLGGRQLGTAGQPILDAYIATLHVTRVTSLGLPTISSDAASKSYVDSSISTHTHPHSGLTALQGGASQNYFHLTNLQWGGLTTGGTYTGHTHSHSGLADLQGGQAYEYFHLTDAQWRAVTGAVGLPAAFGYIDPLVADGNDLASNVSGRCWYAVFRPEYTVTISGVAIPVVNVASGYVSGVGIVYDSSWNALSSTVNYLFNDPIVARTHKLALTGNVQLVAGSVYYIGFSIAGSGRFRYPVSADLDDSYSGGFFTNTAGYGSFENPRTSALKTTASMTARGLIATIP